VQNISITMTVVQVLRFHAQKDVRVEAIELQ
jgi:hypothetical protein